MSDEKRTAFKSFGELLPENLTLTDQEYDEDSIRKHGLKSGQIDIRTLNKLYKQLSKASETSMEFASKYSAKEVTEDTPTAEIVQSFAEAVLNVTNVHKQSILPEVPETYLYGKVRNLILNGRMVDGYPNFLQPGYGELIDLRHAPGELVGPNSTISATSFYNATYPIFTPLVNYHAVIQGGGWLAANGSKEAVVTITLNDPQPISCIEIVWANIGDVPKMLLIEGVIPGTNDTVTLVNIKDHELSSLTQTTRVDRAYSRMYHTDNNTIAVNEIRMTMKEPMTSAHVGRILSTRFYTNDGIATDKFDVLLRASEEIPLKLSIAKGMDGDQIIEFDQNQVISGHKLYETSRNYIYIVPGNSDTTPPDYIKNERYIYVPKNNSYIVISLRKILSCGDVREIERQCWVMLQSNVVQSIDSIVERVGSFKSGAYKQKIKYAMGEDVVERPRGAKSSFVSNAGTTYIASEDLSKASLDPQGSVKLGDIDFTVEIDFKYNGPTEASTDALQVLFNLPGHYMIGYYHRRKQIAMYYDTTYYYFPFSASENWHTLSTSKVNNILFIHVDGKCIAQLKDLPPLPRHAFTWYVGRWEHHNSAWWRGWLNNFKLTVGQGLYQSADYDVPEIFDTGLIPHDTRWYDHNEGVVKTWDTPNKKWDNTPMICIGHIDTNWKEHLHTNEPLGTTRTGNAQATINESFKESNTVANFTSKSLLNFAESGNYSFRTPTGAAVNTTEYTAEFATKEPVSFEELRLINGISAWINSPREFLFKQSKNLDGSDQVITVDESTLSDAGNICSDVATPLGINHIVAMKKYPITDTEKYTHHQLAILPRGTEPFYTSVYTCCRLQLILRGAKPEIISCASYNVGDMATYGPIAISNNQEYSFPINMGGLNYMVDGYIVEIEDQYNKARRMGQFTYILSGTSHSTYGEIIYAKENEVVIVTGVSGLSIPFTNGKHNSPSVSTSSSQGMLYLRCRRMF